MSEVAAIDGLFPIFGRDDLFETRKYHPVRAARVTTSYDSLSIDSDADYHKKETSVIEPCGLSICVFDDQDQIPAIKAPTTRGTLVTSAETTQCS